MSKLEMRSLSALLLAVSAVRLSNAATYYVSPAGSDSNAGTSSAAPWASVSKVDATAFQPGDQILFQYGSTYNGSLNATSSGTPSAPITYSAYGNASLGNPVFNGSDKVAASAFTQVSGTTYSMTPTTAVNWVYDNNQFTREAQDVTGATDTATNISYVKNNTNSFYYTPTGTLYVNLGTNSLSSQTISLGTRADAVFNNLQSNLVFNHLSTANTAQDNGGYGIRVQNGTNVTVENATVTNGGKHGIGAIDADSFKGLNLTVNGLQPDLGFGGASAYVAFSDIHTASYSTGGDSSNWTNLGYTNANGPYQEFITHGDAGAIKSITLNNLTSLNGYGTGVDLQPTQTSEKVILRNSQFSGGAINVGTTGAVLDGLTLTDNAQVLLSGTHDVVQNSRFYNENPNVQAGINGAIVDGGSNNTIRFNTFNFYSLTGPAVGITSPTTGTHLYANVFNTPQEIALQYPGSTAIDSHNNLYAYTGYPNYDATFAYGPVLDVNYITSLAQWQATGNDPGSVLGTAVFAPDMSLTAGSAGLDIYNAALDPTLSDANAYLTPNYGSSGYNAGIDTAPITVPEPIGFGLIATATGVVLRRRRANRA